MEIYLAVGGVVIAFICLLCFFNWFFKSKQEQEQEQEQIQEHLSPISEDIQTGLTGPGKDLEQDLEQVLEQDSPKVAESGSLESMNAVNPISADHYSLTDV